jgi:putative Holliday junction resolvase
MALDFGVARIGVAVSSADGLICTPLTTVVNDSDAISRVLALISEQEPIEVYVGLPLNLQGNRTASTDSAIAFARSLSSGQVAGLRLVDERMSTRAAQIQLHSSGKTSRQSKAFIDAAAATLILESALALENSTGRIPGHEIAEFDE